MENKGINNIKLGVFVLSGLLFLIILMYMIGKNKNIFGSNFRLRARFENLQGLKAGNNVRYAGIDAGTVKEINIINDTVIEVVMILNKKVKKVIRKNAIVSIGTDGLVGNKVVNITAVKNFSEIVEDNDILPSRKPVDTDEMIRTLYKTNYDAGIIAENIKTTIQRINNSKAVWETLNDTMLPENLNMSITNIRETSQDLSKTMKTINEIVNDIKKGDGLLSTIIYDTSFFKKIKQTSINLEKSSYKIDSTIQITGNLIRKIDKSIDEGPGSLHKLLRDSSWANKMTQSLDNIEKGTDGFNQNMEALKHNFLLRGYFKKTERQKAKAKKQ